MKDRDAVINYKKGTKTRGGKRRKQIVRKEGWKHYPDQPKNFHTMMWKIKLQMSPDKEGAGF